MLFFAIQLDEEKIIEEGIINLEGAYRCIEATFAQRDVTLHRIENGIRYYTRDIDYHDFEYLWMVNSPLGEEYWFKYYIKFWHFIITDDETNEIEEDEDLLDDPGVPFVRPLRPYGEICEVLLAIALDERKLAEIDAGKANALRTRFERLVRTGGLRLHKTENGVTFYSGVKEEEGFRRLWRVNKALMGDEELGEYIRVRKFVIDTDDTGTLEVEGNLADRWVPEEELQGGRGRLFLAVKLNEAAIEDERRIDPRKAYDTIEKNFRQRDIFLHEIIDDVYYYSRELDHNDFAYLWLAAGKCKRATWFQYYVEQWKFIITDETGRVRKEIDLMQDWLTSPDE